VLVRQLRPSWSLRSLSQQFEPTAEQRRTVQVLSGIGVPQDQIALIIGVDPKTLRKTCRDDLDRGMAEANTKVAQTLFSMATRGDNTAATIFWMKARAGWREKQEVVVEPGTGWFMMGVPEAPSVEAWVDEAQRVMGPTHGNVRDVNDDGAV